MILYRYVHICIARLWRYGTKLLVVIEAAAVHVLTEAGSLTLDQAAKKTARRVTLEKTKRIQCLDDMR